MDKMTLTLNSPLTDEQLDAIMDVDFDNTNEIYFHTKHGKEVYFVKRKKGKWIQRSDMPWYYYCSNCHRVISVASIDQMEKFHAFCGTCGADMREDKNNETMV